MRSDADRHAQSRWSTRVARLRVAITIARRHAYGERRFSRGIRSTQNGHFVRCVDGLPGAKLHVGTNQGGFAMVVLQILFVILAFLTLDYFVSRRRTVRASAAAAVTTPATSDAGVGMPSWKGEHVPAGVFLAPGHVWLEPEPSGTVRVGVDRMLLTLLGGLENIYSHPEGTALSQGGPLMMLRCGHRALKVRSPVDGVISAINHEAQENPQRVPEDPFGAWIYRITPRRLSGALKRMVRPEDASGWLRLELGRLRDALAGLPRVAEQLTLADGGLPLDDLAERLDDAEWETLVARFFAAPEK